MNIEPRLINLSLEDAQTLASSEGHIVRELIRDGKPLLISHDFIANRINVATVLGKVASVVNRG
jgi:hypothetical protein